MVDAPSVDTLHRGNTNDLKEHIKAIGGKYKKGLTINGEKVPGWIFSKGQLGEVQAVLAEVVGEDIQEKKIVTTEKTLYDIMTDHELTQRERNIIKCFGRDPNIVHFLKSELSDWNVDKKIYNEKFLIRFLACLDSYDKSKKDQQALIKKYQKRSHKNLAADIVSRLQPSTVPTFMFLIFILYKVSSRIKEKYLERLMGHLTNTDDIQQCLCDNADTETLLSTEDIKNVPMKELYLLPSGRCVHLDDLIVHLKSDNKIIDPTYDPFKHGDTPTLTWTNGWELRAMLDRIQHYNYQEGSAIKKEFQKVIKDITTKIPEETKTLINDVYPLFYFPEESNKQHIIDMLVKYGYPTGEPPGDVNAAKAIVAKGTGGQLDEFRTLLGFKVGHHIIEELAPEERDAFLFAGEFAGMGKEAWGKLSMGEFCTKSFGSSMHRMGQLFTGNISM